jgi:hypothetical protein
MGFIKEVLSIFKSQQIEFKFLEACIPKRQS